MNINSNPAVNINNVPPLSVIAPSPFATVIHAVKNCEEFFLSISPYYNLPPCENGKAAITIEFNIRELLTHAITTILPSIPAPANAIRLLQATTLLSMIQGTTSAPIPAKEQDSDKPIIAITNLTELEQVKGNNHYLLSNNIDAANMTSSIASFSGILDGNQFEITNLKHCLIEKLQEGELKNIRINHADITGKCESVKQGSILKREVHLGAATCQSVNSTVDSVTLSNSKIHSLCGPAVVGGITGTVSGEQSRYQNLVANNNILNVKSINTHKGSKDVGGVIGEIQGTIHPLVNLTSISNIINVVGLTPTIGGVIGKMGDNAISSTIVINNQIHAKGSYAIAGELAGTGTGHLDYKSLDSLGNLINITDSHWGCTGAHLGFNSQGKNYCREITSKKFINDIKPKFTPSSKTTSLVKSIPLQEEAIGNVAIPVLPITSLSILLAGGASALLALLGYRCYKKRQAEPQEKTSRKNTSPKCDTVIPMLHLGQNGKRSTNEKKLREKLQNELMQSVLYPYENKIETNTTEKDRRERLEKRLMHFDANMQPSILKTISSHALDDNDCDENLETSPLNREAVKIYKKARREGTLDSQEFTHQGRRAISIKPDGLSLFRAVLIHQSNNKEYARCSFRNARDMIIANFSPKIKYCVAIALEKFQGSLNENIKNSPFIQRVIAKLPAISVTHVSSLNSGYHIAALFNATPEEPEVQLMVQLSTLIYAEFKEHFNKNNVLISEKDHFNCYIDTLTPEPL